MGSRARAWARRGRAQPSTFPFSPPPAWACCWAHPLIATLALSSVPTSPPLPRSPPPFLPYAPPPLHPTPPSPALPPSLPLPTPILPPSPPLSIPLPDSQKRSGSAPHPPRLPSPAQPSSPPITPSACPQTTLAPVLTPPKRRSSGAGGEGRHPTATPSHMRGRGKGGRAHQAEWLAEGMPPSAPNRRGWRMHCAMTPTRRNGLLRPFRRIHHTEGVGGGLSRGGGGF